MDFYYHQETTCALTQHDNTENIVKCHIDKHVNNGTGTENTNRNKQDMQQKSCGDYLDDLRKQLQVMLQDELWQSEMFVWVTVLDM